MTDLIMDQAEQMARDGKAIVQICDELGVGWRDVRKHLHSVDVKSWQGAKKVITHRLKRLPKEKEQAVREQLTADASMWIDYLYYEAKRVNGKVDRARKALDG